VRSWASARWLFGERIVAMPSAIAWGSLAYQTLVVSTTFIAWFALIVRFSANRLRPSHS